METGSRRGWLTGLGVVVICLPCLLGPLVALGAGAVLAGLGGFVLGNLLLVAVGAALTLLLVAALVVRRRRAVAASCALPSSAGEPPAVESAEAR